MSYLAIGAVTNSLAQLLTRKLNKPPLLGSTFTVRVTTLPPDDDRVSEDTGVNLFLYKVAENVHLRNMPWRGERPQGNGSSRPPLALNLHYLLTAYAKRVANGTQDDVTAHQLLGNAMAVLNDNPVLNDVHDADFDADVDTQFAAELRNAFEKVKVSLMPIAIDEFSKIWTGLAKAYRLSVAYEVSLVQIAPLRPATLPPPAVQRAVVRAAPIASPAITDSTPASGPVGTTVTLTGGPFIAAGAATSILVGGVTLEEGDFVSLSSDTLVFNVPSSVTGGPSIPIVVSVGDRESNPVSYLVRPWISTLLPVRGDTGLPVTIPFEVPAGATVTAEVGGGPATATVNPERTLVTVVIPTTIPANGLTPVELIVNDGAPRRTNALLYQVLPVIRALTITTPGAPPRTRVEVTGERLAGSEVHLRFGKLVARISPSTNPTDVAFQFDRLLNQPGAPVSVIVDGRESNTLPRRLTKIEPPRAGAGERVTLVGTSLAGRVVVVHVGAQNVNVGAQPLSSRFEIRIPAALAAGATTISVTVDGSDTNTVPFTVIP
jgi:hypothetical protein